jgi:hypothetical protein
MFGREGLWKKCPYAESACLYRPVIPALGRLRQEDCKFEVSLGYTGKPCLKRAKCPRSEPHQFSQDLSHFGVHGPFSVLYLTISN